MPAVFAFTAAMQQLPIDRQRTFDDLVSLDADQGPERTPCAIWMGARGR